MVDDMPPLGTARTASSSGKSTGRRVGRSKGDGSMPVLVSKREEYVEREAGFLKEIKSLKAQIADLRRSLQRKDESNKKLRKDLQRKSAEQDATQNESLKLSTEYEQLIATKEGTIEQMMRGFDEERAALKKARFAAEEKKRSAVRAMKKEKQLRQEAELIVEEERLKAEKANQLYSKAKKDQVIAAAKTKEAVDTLTAQRKAFSNAVETKDTMEKQRKELEDKHRLQVEALEKQVELLSDSSQTDTLEGQVVKLTSDLEEKTTLVEQMEGDVKASKQVVEENTVLVSSLTQEVKTLTEQLQAQQEKASHEVEEGESSSIRAEKEELFKRLETIQTALANRNISVEFLLGTSSLGSSSPTKAGKRMEKANSKPEVITAEPKSKQKLKSKPKPKATNSGPPKAKPIIHEGKPVVKRRASQSKIVVKPVQRKTPAKSKEDKLVNKERGSSSAEQPSSKALTKVTTLPKVKLKLRNTDHSKSGDGNKPPRRATVPTSTPTNATNNITRTPQTTQPRSTDERHEVESVRKTTAPKTGTSSSSTSSSRVRVAVRQDNANGASRVKRPRRTNERDRSRRSANQAESPGSRRSVPSAQPPSQSTAQRRPRKPKPVAKQENLSKLDLGMNAADIAPESSPRSETNSEGGIHSLLFARPDNDLQPLQTCAS